MRYCYNCFQSMADGAAVCPSCGYKASAQTDKYPMALPPGTVLNGRYILGRVLGQGGFGITYVAQDHKTGSLVAVKEYFPDTMAARTGGPSVSAYTGQREENFLYGKECFLNEAKTLAEFIGNPNIVRVHSYFEENNTAYFVMDYVQGTSLQDYLKQRGRLSWEETKHILEPVIEALASVHSRGVIHRDVTPDNIYITNDGTVKLLDFGAARYSLGDKSRSLDVVLKHGYAPREQYSRHGRQGPYTDVYALGATFYYCLTGRLPPDSIDRQDEDEFILPSSLGVKLPAKAEDALCKALAVSAQDRFQSMGEFYLALNEGGRNPRLPCRPGRSLSLPVLPQNLSLGRSPGPFPLRDLHPRQGRPLLRSLHLHQSPPPHREPIRFLPSKSVYPNGLCRLRERVPPWCCVWRWPPLSAARGTRNCLWTTLLRLVRFLSLPKARRNLPLHLR